MLQDSLQQFLTKHGFDDVKHPRQLGKLTARVKMQCVYPIHVAADIGGQYGQCSTALLVDEFGIALR
jgi:hypothetical protein